METNRLRDTVGKYIVLCALFDLLTHIVCLASSKMCRAGARATKLSVRGLYADDVILPYLDVCLITLVS